MAAAVSHGTAAAGSRGDADAVEKGDRHLEGGARVAAGGCLAQPRRAERGGQRGGAGKPSPGRRLKAAPAVASGARAIEPVVRGSSSVGTPSATVLVVSLPESVRMSARSGSEAKP